jgi:hypothetical protein
VFLPVAVCYLAVAPITPFINDIVSYPVHYYARMRSLPFPGPRQIYRSPADGAVYLPILIFCATIYSVFLSRGEIRKRGHAHAGDSAAEQLRTGC